jgi:hypothetical protein
MRLRDGRGRPGRDEEDTRNEHYVLTPQYPSASSSFVCWPGQAVVAGRSTERTSTQRGRYRCRRAGVDHARPIGPNFIPRAVRHALRKSNARLLGRWPGQREWGRLADCDAIRYSDAMTSHCRHHGRRASADFCCLSRSAALEWSATWSGDFPVSSPVIGRCKITYYGLV